LGSNFLRVSNIYIYGTGDQFIEPCGFSGSPPLLFVTLLVFTLYTAENELVVVVTED